MKKVWVIEVGEPLHLLGVKPRAMRAGLLCKRLAAYGVEVTWWVSNFNHREKEFYKVPNVPPHTYRMQLDNKIFYRFLRGRAYTRNISLSRVLHNYDVAQDFKYSVNFIPAPDVILCCYPTVDLAAEAVSYANTHKIPIIIDVRDLWPDVFLDILRLPKFFNQLFVPIISYKATYALKNASGISAISPKILEWAKSKAKRSKNYNDRVFPLSYERLYLSSEQRILSIQQWQSLGLKLDGSELIACCFGTISDVPEFETILDAIDFLPLNLLSKVRIVICGTGPRLEWLRTKVKNYSQVIVTGLISPESINILMEFSYVGLLPYPSREDLLMSYPNKIGEYLSAGLPVISTLSGASEQFLNEWNCGITVRNHDAFAFANALSLLSKRDKVWTDMNVNAKKAYSEMFNSNVTYRNMAKYLLSFVPEFGHKE